MSSPDVRNTESQMDKLRLSTGEPQVRFLVACPRSGSTLLTRVFDESPVCTVTSRLVLLGKSGSKDDLGPHHLIFENTSQHSTFISASEAGKQFFICKEELGIHI